MNFFKMKNIVLKRLFLSFALLVFFTPLSMWAQADAITKYFNKYMDDEDFTVVYITPKMFQMISKLDLKDKDAHELKEVLQDLKGLRILTTEKNPLQHYKEIINSFKPTDYELLMSVRDKGENVKFWTRESGNVIQELFMLVGGADEFVMISFIGNINLNKLSKLSNNMKVDGIEHLKDLKDKD